MIFACCINGSQCFYIIGLAFTWYSVSCWAITYYHFHAWKNDYLQDFLALQRPPGQHMMGSLSEGELPLSPGDARWNRLHTGRPGKPDGALPLASCRLSKKRQSRPKEGTCIATRLKVTWAVLCTTTKSKWSLSCVYWCQMIIVWVSNSWWHSLMLESPCVSHCNLSLLTVHMYIYYIDILYCACQDDALHPVPSGRGATMAAFMDLKSTPVSSSSDLSELFEDTSMKVCDEQGFYCNLVTCFCKAAYCGNCFPSSTISREWAREKW